MYESHFGLTGPPFSLNPDPAFYFASRGHRNALAYLKFGVYQAEGFVVVTGEIGAGKTTLVRTLLGELDPGEIAAAQIVSTQLEAGDLLRSVALAFGIATKGLSKAELIASIEAFLTHLVIVKKRALLVVDEAQNLERAAVEELRMLSNFQLGSRALLQSFLVGQPELRPLLNSKPLEQFRQRVIASCHLGPMALDETRGYVEHRLHQVGWNVAKPAFDDTAFKRIFDRTAGVPRRVNLLCNRLLLSAYLESADRIDADTVDRVGEEMRLELGEAT
jgi:putative secretion ATPase (PEP-CTERM system associated)